MRFFTSIGLSRTSKPATLGVPSLGGRKQVRLRMVVVFPAPLGPRKPTICPFATSNEMWSTAVLRAYLLVSSFTVIIRGLSQGTTVYDARTVQLLDSSRLNVYVKNLRVAMSNPSSRFLSSMEAR